MRIRNEAKRNFNSAEPDNKNKSQFSSEEIPLLMPNQTESPVMNIPNIKGKINNKTNYIYTIEENTNQTSFISDQEMQHQFKGQQKLSQLNHYEAGISLNFQLKKIFLEEKKVNTILMNDKESENENYNLRRQLFTAPEDVNHKSVIQTHQTQINDLYPASQSLITSNRHKTKPNVPMLNLAGGRILKSPNVDISNKKISFPLNSAQAESLVLVSNSQQTQMLSPIHPNQMIAINPKGDDYVGNDFINSKESPQKYEGSLVYYSNY